MYLTVVQRPILSDFFVAGGGCCVVPYNEELIVYIKKVTVHFNLGFVFLFGLFDLGWSNHGGFPMTSVFHVLVGHLSPLSNLASLPSLQLRTCLIFISHLLSFHFKCSTV